jgi:shikimate kinase
MSKIVITGFMGSGKSSVAKALAQLLGCEMIDLDEAIASEDGRSAAEIIQEDGERRFRQLEQQVLSKLLQSPVSQVVALGGGAWISEANRRLVANQQATSVWLDAPFSLCWKRIEADGERRPLAPSESAAFKLFSERTSCYELADLRVVVTAQKSAVAIAGEIAGALKGRHSLEQPASD